MKHARNGGPDIAFRLARRVVATVADDMSTMQRVGAGIVAALVAISPFGAWNAAEAQTDPLTTGTPVEVGPFEVTVVKAATADELGYLVPQPGNHLLGVVVDVTNTGEVPEYSSTLGRAISAPKNVGIVPEVPLEDLGADTAAPDTAIDTGSDVDPSPGPSASAGSEEPRLPSARIFNVEDATSFKFLNPDVTYRLVLIWEQSDKWSGKAVPLEMLELEWVEDDPQGLDDGHWFPNEVAFQGQIPVKAATSEATDAEAGQQ